MIAFISYSIFALLPFTLAAQQPSADTATEAILIPVTASGLVGANGAVWDTQFFVSNTTDSPIVYFFGPCNVSCCCAEMNTFSPQGTGRSGGSSPRGQWYQFPADGSLQIQARFRDRTRSAHWAGVELPIVRERDFRNGELNLIGVPVDEKFRAMIRVYALTSGVVARVEQLDEGGRLLRQDDLSLEPPVGASPAYAQFSIASAPPESPPVRIRVRSLTPGARLWAFASVTNNESGQVTLVTPW